MATPANNSSNTKTVALNSDRSLAPATTGIAMPIVKPPAPAPVIAVKSTTSKKQS